MEKGKSVAEHVCGDIFTASYALLPSRMTAAYSVAMQPCSHPGGNAVATNNISVLVNKYRRLRHLLVPLDDLCKIVSYIRRYSRVAAMIHHALTIPSSRVFCPQRQMVCVPAVSTFLSYF